MEGNSPAHQLRMVRKSSSVTKEKLLGYGVSAPKKNFLAKFKVQSFTLEPEKPMKKDIDVEKLPKLGSRGCK